MKLGKIKQVCKAARQVLILTADRTVDNAVVQWIGTAGALYPVTGLELTLQMLAVLWEIDLTKGDWEAAEGTMSDMVDRGLLAPEDEQLLRTLPASVDTTSMPLLGLGEVNGYKALACGAEGMLFLQGWPLDPCYGKAGCNYEVVRGADYRVAVYSGGMIAGLVWPVEKATADALGGFVSSMARRTVCGV